MQIEWVTAISSAIAGIVGALGGGGVMYFRQNKAAKEIENSSNLAAEWQKLFVESKAEVAEKEAKIDEMRKELNELQSRVNKLEVSLSHTNYWRCEVVDCKNRRPPLFVTSTTENAK